MEVLYISPRGRDKVLDWYRNLTKTAQAEFDATLEYLEQRTRTEWERPQFAPMSGKYRDLGEIRFQADRVQHRVFGFFGPERLQFCLLIGATKRGDQYDPADALETALKRLTEVSRDKGRANDRDF